MDRRRINRIEELVSAAREERGRLRPLGSKHARPHATAVAAIVLSGQPRVDEPLIRAWERALRHYRIDVKEPCSSVGQVEAAQRLLPIIRGDEEESAKFTEVFSTAPVWLLQFTRMFFDAHLLGFRLPHMTEKLGWGSAGFEDARRWPSLPLGKMTAGDPIPDNDDRQWVLAILSVSRDPIPDFEEIISREDEEYRGKDPLIKDFFFARALDGKPEEQWSRYEHRRMRQFSERISRLKGGGIAARSQDGMDYAVSGRARKPVSRRI
jgi:hypothetical protein